MTMTLGGFTHNEPAEGDWAKGAAGTGEAEWTYSGCDRINLKAGAIIENWEIPEAGHIIFHVRKGVHFSLDPSNAASKLVGGREMTAEDIAYTLNRLCTTPRAYLKTAYPRIAAGAVITAPDKWTVDITVPVSEFADAHAQFFDRNHIIAHEVVEKYGDVNDWTRQVGTGPYIIKDYVAGSSVNFERNPNYWRTDPVGLGKGNQLPYTDTAKLLIIIDPSTLKAALRTGKIDQGRVDTLEDKKDVTMSAPDLQYLRYIEHATYTISMHLYDPNLPTHDVRVRQALMMATDFNDIAEQLYLGDAQINTWPFPYEKEYASMYLPLDEAPASVQELYSHNTTKAKALLAEAGYPNGFKTTIDCRNLPLDVDFLSVIKDQWSKVGVDLEINPLELGVHSSTWRGLKYTDMLLAGGMGIGGYYRMIHCDTPSYWNPSQVNDPYVQEVKKQIVDYFNQGNWNQVDATFKELTKYCLEQAWYIPRPLPYSYVLWWPWVKNYHGELNLGWAGPQWRWCQYVWVDQGLKKSMGY